MTDLPTTLQSLLELQRIDRQIQRAKRAQAALDTGETAEAAVIVARDLYTAKNDAFHKASGDLKDTELQLAALETKLKTYQQRLYQGGITNARELANIEKEIGALGRQRSDLDGKILELMDEVERKNTETKVAEGAWNAADNNCQCVVEEFRAHYEKLSQELQDLSRQRAESLKVIEDAALLKRYDELRAKAGGIAIVQILQQNCGGCNMTLPTAQIKHVRDGDAGIQYCENCGRMLAR
jgi:predicted  nucleic acid-binding Zn-ribbon protein